MQHSLLSGSLLTMLAMVMAGCTGTGNFDVQQTEPFRVSLEGEPQTVVVSEDDSEGKEVVIDTCDDPCADNNDDCADACDVNVKVQVKQTSSDVCRIMVIIKDRDSGEVLDQVEIDGSDGGDDGGDDTTTTGNGTTSATMTGDVGGDTNVVVQNIVVNVKGKDNIVVLTQAIEGSADVDISAARASGNGEIDMDDEDDGSTSTSSATMTTTGNSTSPP